MDAFDVIDRQQEEKDYPMGSFTIADTTLYYPQSRAADVGDRDLPPNVNAHSERMNNRASVKESLKSMPWLNLHYVMQFFHRKLPDGRI